MCASYLLLPRLQPDRALFRGFEGVVSTELRVDSLSVPQLWGLLEVRGGPELLRSIYAGELPARCWGLLLGRRGKKPLLQVVKGL